LKPNVLQCLSDLSSCRLQDTLLYRLPPQGELPSWVDKIKAARAPMERKFGFEARAEALLPASYRVYKYVSERVRHPEVNVRSDHAEDQSRAAIAEMIRLYGAHNVAFIHLPQKEEVGHGPDDRGIRARRAIAQAGGTLFDGFKQCGLTAADYYADDEHPNSAGYAKIAQCVGASVKEMLAPDAH
jgi:hypothetical protein